MSPPQPDRWSDYSKMGSVIPGTQILCFKVPLKEVLLRQVPEEMWFTPRDLITLVREKGHTLEMVIDLTFTTKYYFIKDFTSAGVQHLKVYTEGHVIPGDEVVYRFFDAVESIITDDTKKGERSVNDDVIIPKKVKGQPIKSLEEGVIGVHCTHGINRTGYMVCRYMIERLAFDPEKAIQAFNTARGHNMERENYIEDLRKRSHNPNYRNEGRHKLKHEKPRSQGQFQRQSNPVPSHAQNDGRGSGKTKGRSGADSENWRQSGCHPYSHTNSHTGDHSHRGQGYGFGGQRQGSGGQEWRFGGQGHGFSSQEWGFGGQRYDSRGWGQNNGRESFKGHGGGWCHYGQPRDEQYRDRRRSQEGRSHGYHNQNSNYNYQSESYHSPWRNTWHNSSTDEGSGRSGYSYGGQQNKHLPWDG